MGKKYFGALKRKKKGEGLPVSTWRDVSPAVYECQTEGYYADNTGKARYRQEELINDVPTGAIRWSTYRDAAVACPLQVRALAPTGGVVDDEQNTFHFTPGQYYTLATDGVNDYASAAASSTRYNISGGATVYAKAKAVDGASGIVAAIRSKPGGTDAGWYVQLTPTQVVFQTFTFGSAAINHGQDMSKEVELHLTLSASHLLRVYVNRALVGTHQFAGSPRDASGRLYVGAVPDFSLTPVSSKIQVSALGIYKAIFTEAQVTGHDSEAAAGASDNWKVTFNGFVSTVTPTQDMTFSGGLLPTAIDLPADSHEESTDNGTTWNVSDDYAVQVGNIYLPEGYVKVRKRALDNGLSGNILSNSVPFTVTVTPLSPPTEFRVSASSNVLHFQLDPSSEEGAGNQRVEYKESIEPVESYRLLLEADNTTTSASRVMEPNKSYDCRCKYRSAVPQKSDSEWLYVLNVSTPVPVVISTAILGSDTIEEGASQNYTVVETYNDGTAVNVTADYAFTTGEGTFLSSTLSLPINYTLGDSRVLTVKATKSDDTSVYWEKQVAVVDTTQDVPIITGRLIPERHNSYHVGSGAGNVMETQDGLTSTQVTMWNGELSGEVYHDVEWVFPIEQQFTLTQMRMYDFTNSLVSSPEDGSKWMRFYYYLHGDNTEYIGPIFKGEKYMEWREFPIAHTGYICKIRMRRLKNSNTIPTEIEFNGTYKPYRPKPILAPLPTMDDILGAVYYWSGFHQGTSPDPNPAKVDLFADTWTVFRDFPDWKHFENSVGEYRFNPSWDVNAFYDNIYTALKAKGVKTIVCLKNITEDMRLSYPSPHQQTSNAPMHYKPEYTTYAADGTTVVTRFNSLYYADKKLPETYIRFGKMAYQMAARWGANANIPAAALINQPETGRAWDTDPANRNQRRVGLNLIYALEAGNEQDKNWDGLVGNMNQWEYFAMLSVFYDGHKGQFHDPASGIYVGAKNADPNMKVYPAGIASVKAGWYTAGVEWCRENRGYNEDGSVNLCFDALNYHSYDNNKAGEQKEGTNRVGVAPEKSNLEGLQRDFVQVSADYCNNIPVLCTESGWDINSPTQSARVTYNPDGSIARTMKQTQGDWLMRAALMKAMIGLKHVTFYEVYDNDDAGTSTTQYMTSGMIEHSGVRRPAANFHAASKALLGEWKPVEKLGDGEIIRIDKWSNGIDVGYWVWVPDQVNRKEVVSISMPTPYVNIHRLQDDLPEFAIIQEDVVDNTYTFQATETPVFLMESNVEVGPSATGMTHTSTSDTIELSWS